MYRSCTKLTSLCAPNCLCCCERARARVRERPRRAFRSQHIRAPAIAPPGCACTSRGRDARRYIPRACACCSVCCQRLRARVRERPGRAFRAHNACTCTSVQGLCLHAVHTRQAHPKPVCVQHCVPSPCVWRENSAGCASARCALHQPKARPCEGHACTVTGAHDLLGSAPSTLTHLAPGP